MSTSQEQASQIESALRRRFFQFVPKIELSERANWPEEQHDTDRLSRSLAAYVLVGMCGIDDAKAAGFITDGRNDGGIDSFHYDRPNNRLLFVQSKFKRTGAAPSQEENIKTVNGIRALQQRRFNEFNQAFQDRLEEIESALDTPGVSIELVLTFLGENLSPHVTNDLKAFQSEMNLLCPCFSWSTIGLSTLHGWLTSEQTLATVSANITLENWAGIPGPRKAIYGLISAASLAQLVEHHGTALFERNIRHYLGSVGVNAAIEETVRRRPADFFYLNNGLTAVAETIIQSPGTPVRCVFGLTNVSIVNGAQTAGAIATAAISGTISPDAKLLITIIEIGAGEDEFGLRITRARNHQNIVRGIDFAALDPRQERLRRELAMAGITYFYRPSAEARARRDDACTVEEAALALACLSFPILHSRDAHQWQRRRRENGVDFAVTAKSEIGRLWEQEGAHYTLLFRDSLSGLRLFRLVRVYRFIDQILAATEQSETKYARRMFFRHGRYFIMSFVAHRTSDVLNRADFSLSADDRNSLSVQTNELAEMIYAQSEPLQAEKGYLAVFRNLTDSQFLADGVLDRLAEKDTFRKMQEGPQAPPHTAVI